MAIFISYVKLPEGIRLELPQSSDFPPGLAAKISVHLPKLLPTSTTSSVAVTTWRAKRLTDVIPYQFFAPKKMIYIKKSVISPLNQ